MKECHCTAGLCFRTVYYVPVLCPAGKYRRRKKCSMKFDTKWNCLWELSTFSVNTIVCRDRCARTFYRTCQVNGHWRNSQDKTNASTFEEERAEFPRWRSRTSFRPNKSDRTHLLLYYLPVSAVIIRNQQQLRRSGPQEALSTETSQKRTAAL